MAIPFDTPVSAIEGIGPAAERLFQPRGVYSVYDLLRARSPDLHAVVSAVASLEEVRAWRQMAVLLEVAAMTPQWVEALVKARVTSLTELRRLDLGELQTLFASARDQGSIPDVPSADQMVAMLTDSTLLDYAGAITGTVKDRDGRPVADATVTAGDTHMLTDPRGRFRIRRLLLNRRVALNISKPSYQALNVSVSPSPTSTVAILQFALQPAVAMRPRASGQGQQSARLSELLGDRMPALQGRDVTSREVPLVSLQPHDLLRLVSFYAEGDDAKLVSKLLDFDGSKFVAHWVRVPKTKLPQEAAVNDHFIKTASGFRKIKMSPRKLNEYKRFLRALRSLRAESAATIPEAAYEKTRRLFARIGGTIP